MPLWRSLTENGKDATSGRSSVSQNAVVCISFSGNSSFPSPTFSFVKNLIFLKPITCERTSTSPWDRAACASAAGRPQMRFTGTRVSSTRTWV